MSQAFPKTGCHAGVYEVTDEPGFPEDWTPCWSVRDLQVSQAFPKTGRHAGVYEITG